MNELLEVVIDLWKWDIAVFSQPWMYWLLCIPASVFLAFFFLKWVVITAPIWLPVVIIIKAFQKNP